MLSLLQFRRKHFAFNMLALNNSEIKKVIMLTGVIFWFSKYVFGTGKISSHSKSVGDDYRTNSVTYMLVSVVKVS